MGTNLPQSPKIDALEWIENHVDVWASVAAPIGLTVEQVSEATAKAVAARNAYEAAEAARQASKAATLTWNNALFDARDSAQGLVSIIKGFADHTGNEDVYAIAQISPPAPPSPTPAPVTPRSLTIALSNMGVVNLAWEGTLANRTFYEVQRSFADTPIESDWTPIGSVANRFFDDNTLPNGTPKAHYRVRAVRGAGGAGSFNDPSRYSSWATTLIVMGAGASGSGQSQHSGEGEGLSLAA